MEGQVTISLDDYLEMQNKLKELDTMKKEALSFSDFNDDAKAYMLQSIGRDLLCDESVNLMSYNVEPMKIVIHYLPKMYR
jgi:hypothetical protein